MRFSSAFKVGILTIAALSILVFTIMWVKGRSLSSGERYTIQFKDVNGIRTGSGVQMMGLRIGQIEEITPVIDGEESYVELKFVITEPHISIPRASEISIQQSGIIGEQFLEITPPKIRNIYIPVQDKSQVIKPGDKIQMTLSSRLHDVGYIKAIEVVETNTLPLPVQGRMKTDYTYKISYIIDLPGLIVPDRLIGKITESDGTMKLQLKPFMSINIPYPAIGLQYTVVEPMRLSDFMALQYQSASSLNETNERISAILTDDVINDLKSTAGNLNDLVVKTGRTVDKAEALLEASRKDIDSIMNSANQVSEKIIVLTDNLNELVTDKDFKKTVSTTADSINRLSTNLNKLLENKQADEIVTNLNATLKNVNEISAYVNEFAKDEKMKGDLGQTVKKLNNAIDQFAVTMDAVNEIAVEDKDKIKCTLNDASLASKNLRKFSEKLNKRFLLFRLMF